MFCEDLRIKANVKVNGITETTVIVAWACNGLLNGSKNFTANKCGSLRWML